MINLCGEVILSFKVTSKKIKHYILIIWQILHIPNIEMDREKQQNFQIYSAAGMVVGNLKTNKGLWILTGRQYRIWNMSLNHEGIVRNKCLLGPIMLFVIFNLFNNYLFFNYFTNCFQ